MVKSKKQRTAVGAANTASPHLSAKLAAKTTSTPSPLLTSAFSPSDLSLSLFASIVRGLDAQRLRIHDTTTSRLRCEHVFDKDVAVNSLAWGILNDADKKKKRKKRKRVSNADDDDDDDDEEIEAGSAVVALSTNSGRIILYSPTQAAVVKVLQGGHPGNILDFQFSDGGKKGRGWSTSGEKLVEWDIRRGVVMRTIALLDKMKIYTLTTLPDSILGASHTTYLINMANPFMTTTPQFSSHTSQIHSLVASKDHESFLSAAEGDRFINVSDIASEKSLGSLVAQGDVLQVAIDSNGVALAAVTVDGAVEVFDQPWIHAVKLLANDAEEFSRRKKPSTRTSVAKITIARPSSVIEKVKLLNASFQGEEIVVAWVENATNVLFERIKWTGSTSASISLVGDISITKSKTAGIGGSGEAGTVMNGVKDVGNTNINQAQTIVVDGADLADIGMEGADEEVDEIVDSEADASDEEDAMDEDEGDEAEDSDDEPEEPSFADKFNALQVSSNNEKSREVTVPSLDDPTKALAVKGASVFTDAISLTTVLSQALKTSDRTLLETCLHTTSPDIIRTTVARLDSLLAAELISHLAALIARKPGRAGSLIIWVETTFIHHGGQLLTRTDLVSKLASLQRVLSRRAESLQRMLALKGRLRLLTAQMEIRNRSRRPTEGESASAVVYVEGENDEDESSDEEGNLPHSQMADDLDLDLDDDLSSSSSDSDSEDDTAAPLANGVSGIASGGGEEEISGEDSMLGTDTSDGEPAGTDEENAEGVGMYLDDEAEETDDDDGDERESESDLDGFVVSDDEVAYDDRDDGILDDGESSEEEEDGEAGLAAKAKTAGTAKRLVKGSRR